MLHCDAETLALLALGDPVADDTDSRHLRTCAQCRSELDELTAVVAAGRRTTGADAVTDPPPQVWQAVRSALDLSADLVPFVPDGRAVGAPAAGTAPVASLAERRARPRRTTSGPLLAAAAAAGLVLGSVTTWAAATERGPAAPEVLAVSTLAAVQAADDAPAGVEGDARVVRRGGQPYLRVDVRGLADSQGYFEVWLLKSDLSGMISLGALSGGSSGQFAIPKGIDLAEYSIVDISDEPFDGDPQHSKASRARGTFTT